MSANQHHRFAAETGNEREARLQEESHSCLCTALKFHAEIAGLEMQKCTTCSEGLSYLPTGV